MTHMCLCVAVLPVRWQRLAAGTVPRELAEQVRFGARPDCLRAIGVGKRCDSCREDTSPPAESAP